MRNLRSVVADHISPKARANLLVLWHERLTPALRRSGFAPLVRRWKLRKHLARPDEVDIEITSVCDADCIMCPRRAMQRRQGAMDLDLFKKIVDESLALGVRGLALNGYGEISTLKNYREYLDYIRRKSQSVRIVINTNAMRMREEMARAYIESGVNLVNVTIDGATAETFENVRRHLKLSQVEENTRRLIELRNASGKRYPMVRVSIIDMPQTHDEIPAFLKKWEGVADQVGVGGFSTRLDSVPIPMKERQRWEETPCWLLWNAMSILVDGTIALCCDDWDAMSPMGNVAESSMKELWTRHAERMRYREMHLRGEAGQIAACAMCRIPRVGPWWTEGMLARSPNGHDRGTPTPSGPPSPSTKSDGLVVLN